MADQSKSTSPRRTRKTKSVSTPQVTHLTPAMIENHARRRRLRKFETSLITAQKQKCVLPVMYALLAIQYAG
ncbi:hypothetical protein [Nitrosomonas ureae]|uniref:Transposase n=1 Tax=Nitrosomonas ureae TaxID=44577 RepID=A0A1H5XR35_9PROT|nr:hypothetical protein [Nitrosomonas ureae]SEG13870.1 hypothetical protein SAMN05216334_13022 [Nitrosomonas ureae]